MPARELASVLFIGHARIMEGARGVSSCPRVLQLCFSQPVGSVNKDQSVFFELCAVQMLRTSWQDEAAKAEIKRCRGAANACGRGIGHDSPPGLEVSVIHHHYNMHPYEVPRKRATSITFVYPFISSPARSRQLQLPILVQKHRAQLAGQKQDKGNKAPC